MGFFELIVFSFVWLLKLVLVVGIMALLLLFLIATVVCALE
jgi:hypothetical protein